LRRRLLVFSAPVALLALLAAVKMISAVVVGNSAASNYREGGAEALGRDTSTLHALNVIEPAKAPFADGALAVLRGRLDEADAHFSKALSLTDAGHTCPILVNLELVRERQGDIDGWEGRRDQARDRYRSALAIVSYIAAVSAFLFSGRLIRTVRTGPESLTVTCSLMPTARRRRRSRRRPRR
jgi:hypothetical protein